MRMKKHSSFQTVSSYITHDNFYCPVTGEQISGGNDLGVPLSVKFLYVDTGFLISVSDDIIKILSEKGYDYEDDQFEIELDEVDKILASHKLFENCVLFKVSTGYGPFSSFFAVFINMDYLKKLK
jgi:hypothetical protein